MRLRTLLSGALCLAPLAIPLQTLTAQARLDRVRANDNRARAGVLGSGVLAVRFEARIAEWHPQGDDAPGIMIPVFAEIGRQPQIPGPLIRVPGGTDVIAVVRNAIPNTVLTLHGLHARPVVGAAFNDSLQLSYGQIQTVRFRLDRPGTYYYWGTTSGAAFGERTRDDGQLTGAIVVDEPGERTPRDRVLVLGMWADSARSELNRHRRRELFVINGRAWPYTDKLVYEKGSSVQWRLINATADAQPMHLNGFLLRVRRRGDGRADTVLGRSELVGTEYVPAGGTVGLSWTADRVGNWILRSHLPAAVAARGPLGVPALSANTLPQPRTTPGGVRQGASPATLPTAMTAMGGLVTAVEITPAEDDTTANLPPAPPPVPAQRLRMLLRPNAGSTPATPFFSVTIDSTGLEPDVAVGQQIGPTLVLTRGVPMSIVVLNRLEEPTSMAWHGIELASQYDGVPGVSGIRPQVTSAIAPGDSFDVRLTPTRAGTFIYHSQLDEARQQRAGLVGALIVADKGKWDATRDLPVVFSSPSDSSREESSVLINGSVAPLALEVRRGFAYRLRLINITSARPGMSVELRQDTTLTTWRPLAKDGVDIPASARGLHTARHPLSIGETLDVEFFPVRAGEYRLEARSRAGTLLATLVIRVD